MTIPGGNNPIHSGSPQQLILWADQLQTAANKHGVPVEIGWGQFGLETGFGTYIGTSSAGAEGLMQFIYSTAVQYGYPYTNYPTVKQSAAQMDAWARYMIALRHQLGSWDQALRSYSGGGYGLTAVIAKSKTRKLPGAPVQGVTPGSPLYINPLAQAHVIPERIDQGVDYAVRSGRLLAIAKCVVHSISSTSWQPYGNYVEYRIVEPGPLQDAFVYYAEGVTPTTHVGQLLHAGDPVCDLIPDWHSGIEIGWAAGAGDFTWAHTYGGGYSEGQQTLSGVNFSAVVQALGGPGGVLKAHSVGRAPQFGIDFLRSRAYLQTGTTPFTITTPSDAGPFAYLVTQLDDSAEIMDAFGQLGVHAHTARVQTRVAAAYVAQTQYCTITGRHL